MISVLHVIETLSDFGGTPRAMFYLATHGRRAGVESSFICFRASQLLDKFEHERISIHNAGTLSPWRLIGRIAAHAKRTRPDVICTHFSRGMICGYAVARLLGLPQIHYEHSSAHYRVGIGRLLVKTLLPGVTTLLCNSAHTANSIAATYAVDRERLHVLRNAVEARSINSERRTVREILGIDAGAMVIGHVGGMIPSRDQRTLISAFHQVHRLHPQARLVLIGDGPVRRSLEWFTAELGLGHAVSFVGYTDRIGDYLGAMDIYVNPTLDEGFGIAVVEAMLARLPVLLSDRGAHPELIAPGVSGLMYRGGDSAALAQALIALIADSDARRRLGDAAARDAAARFAPEAFAQGFRAVVEDTLYRHAANRSRRSRAW